MTVRELQCPQCGGSFSTSNRTKRFCDTVCQNKHKNTVRTQRDFKDDYQAQHRRNSGAAASKRASEGPPQVDWPAVLRRFKRDMTARYEGETE